MDIGCVDACPERIKGSLSEGQACTRPLSAQSLGSDVFVTALFRQIDLPLTFFETPGAIVVEFIDAMRARNALPIVR